MGQPSYHKDLSDQNKIQSQERGILENMNQQQKTKAYLISSLLAFLGFGLSLYAMHHQQLIDAFGQSSAYCNIDSFLNCDLLAQSQYSRFLSVPLAVWGASFFFYVFLLSFFLYRLASSSYSLKLLFSLPIFLAAVISIILALFQLFLFKHFA